MTDQPGTNPDEPQQPSQPEPPASAPPPPYGQQPPPPPSYGQPPPPSYAQQPPPPQYGQQPPGGYPGAGAYGQMPSAGAPGTPPPPNYLVWSILTTVLCCLPLGIVSIVYAAQVNGKWTSGDFAGAQNSSNKAKQFAIISAVVGVVVSAIFIAVRASAGS